VLALRPDRNRTGPRGAGRKYAETRHRGRYQTTSRRPPGEPAAGAGRFLRLGQTLVVRCGGASTSPPAPPVAVPPRLIPPERLPSVTRGWADQSGMATAE